MQIKENVSLKEYTTLRIGGMCRKMYFPEQVEELKTVLAEHPGAPILGGGSNLLINDEMVWEAVICLRSFQKKIEYDGVTVRVGSGVRLQKLIEDINSHGLGGIEYLYSVPGLVGGAIYMNAGRGRGANRQISDYLLSVDVLEDGEVKTYRKEECEFSYRFSVFHQKDAVILSAVFRFLPQEAEEGKRLQRERLALCKQFQDNAYPNAGTTFSLADPRIMDIMKRLSPTKKGGVQFSKKATNWLQNRGGGTFRGAMKLLGRVKRLHKLFGKPCKLEYKIWSDQSK